MITRRDALAALSTAAALPLMSSCRDDAALSSSVVPAAPPDADALKLLDSVADNLLRLQPESATSLGIDTGARAALRSQLADRSAEGQQRLATQVRSRPGARQGLRHDGPVARRRAPASRSCAAPMPRRSKASRCRTATSRSAAGATRRTSSFRTSAPISTSRASSTAIIASTTPPTPRRIWRGCSRTRSSSMASSAGCRRRAPPGSCRRRS